MRKVAPPRVNQPCPRCGRATKKSLYSRLSTPEYFSCESCNRRFKIQEIPPAKEEADALKVMERVCLEQEPNYEIRAGRVTGLSLELGRLMRLPEKIGNFTALEHLNLMRNNLFILPQIVQKLQSLKSLDLDTNRFIEVPEEVFELPNLEYLNLNHNYISQLPSKIQNLTKLKGLQIRGNRLKELPEEICNLPCLNYLFLTRNPLHQLPSNFGNLKNLQALNLRKTYLEDFPASFERLESLEFLRLSYFPNSDVTPLLRLPALKCLWIDHYEEDGDYGQHEYEISGEEQAEIDRTDSIIHALKQNGVKIKRHRVSDTPVTDWSWREYLSQTRPTPEEIEKARQEKGV